MPCFARARCHIFVRITCIGADAEQRQTDDEEAGQLELSGDLGQGQDAMSARVAAGEGGFVKEIIRFEQDARMPEAMSADQSSSAKRSKVRKFANGADAAATHISGEATHEVPVLPRCCRAV